MGGLDIKNPPVGFVAQYNMKEEKFKVKYIWDKNEYDEEARKSEERQKRRQ